MDTKSLVSLLLLLFISVHCDLDAPWNEFTEGTTQRMYFMGDDELKFRPNRALEEAEPHVRFQDTNWMKLEPEKAMLYVINEKLVKRSISSKDDTSSDEKSSKKTDSKSEYSYPVPSKAAIPEDYRSAFNDRKHYTIVSSSSSSSETSEVGV